jgi:hypothetical protein
MGEARQAQTPVRIICALICTPDVILKKTNFKKVLKLKIGLFSQNVITTFVVLKRRILKT